MYVLIFLSLSISRNSSLTSFGASADLEQLSCNFFFFTGLVYDAFMRFEVHASGKVGGRVGTDASFISEMLSHLTFLKTLALVENN